MTSCDIRTLTIQAVCLPNAFLQELYTDGENKLPLGPPANTCPVWDGMPLLVSIPLGFVFFKMRTLKHCAKMCPGCWCGQAAPLLPTAKFRQAAAIAQGKTG